MPLDSGLRTKAEALGRMMFYGVVKNELAHHEISTKKGAPDGAPGSRE